MNWEIVLILAMMLGILLILPPSLRTPLAPPTPLSGDTPSIHLTREHITGVAMVAGGESITSYPDHTLVTGTLDGYLVAFDPYTLAIKGRVKCPDAATSLGPCRILGLRSNTGVDSGVIGVDMRGRLFQFAGEKFHWLIDHDHPDLQTQPPGFFNDLVVVADAVYITDSYRAGSNQHMLQRFYSLEDTGRILKYNATTRRISVFVDNLHIPNGIELHYDNRTLLVAEGNRYRVLRIDLDSGQVMGMFGEGTLGAVDNIRRSKDGKGFWIGVSAGRTTTSSLPDILSRYPLLRHSLTSHSLLSPLLMAAMAVWAEPPRVYKVDGNGQVEMVVWGEEELLGGTALSEVSEEEEGVIIVGSPFSTGIHRIRLSGGQ